MGRNAKPERLHVLQGTKPQAKPREDSGLVAGKPPVPRSLSPEARFIFRKLCRQLLERRALTRGDCELLRLFAVAWDRQRQAEAALQAGGLVVKYTRLDSNGQPHEVEKPNLHLAIAERAEKQMLSILDRLGLSPVAREKVKPTGQAEAAYASASEASREAEVLEFERALGALKKNEAAAAQASD